MVTYIYTLLDGTITGMQENRLEPLVDGFCEHEYDGSVSDVKRLLTGKDYSSNADLVGKSWPPSPEDIADISVVPESTFVASTASVPELSFEAWRQQRIDQMSTAIGRLLSKTDWVEIRQADPDEPTKLSDTELKEFRAGRREIRQLFEDYKVKMLTLTTEDDVSLYQKATLLDISSRG